MRVVLWKGIYIGERRRILSKDCKRCKPIDDAGSKPKLTYEKPVIGPKNDLFFLMLPVSWQGSRTFQLQSMLASSTIISFRAPVRSGSLHYSSGTEVEYSLPCRDPLV